MDYRYRTTTIDTIDTGDDSILNGAWLAGSCRGVRLGLYVLAHDGELSGYELADFTAWNVNQDFEAAGIDPNSKRAASLLKSWISAVKAIWPKIVADRS
ncbi:MAG: hypothetical protein EHM45_25010 [Desulfobacteraceae bacterium]|nr:MAG: hypothetical protein EHM45_25010 [Desulfobacteraceae bacterium]